MGMLTRRLPKFRWFQSRPKTAWCCRWVLGSVAVMIAIYWAASWRVGVYAWAPRWGEISLERGWVYVENDVFWPDGKSYMANMGVPRPGVDVQVGSTLGSPVSLAICERLLWITLWEQPTSRKVALSTPIWLLACGPMLISLAAWRNRWVVKREVGTCPTCGYSRTGLAETAPCPECGTAQAAPIAKS